MHSVCCCSLPVWRRRFLKKGTPRDLFLSRPGSAPGRIWPKNNNTCKGPWVLHTYQVSSKSIKQFWRRSWKCESLQTDDDGRTDDGRCAMTIAHSSLWLRWAKNEGELAKMKEIMRKCNSWHFQGCLISLKIHLYGKTNTLINFTASMYSHPCSSTNFYFVIFQHFFIFLSNCLHMQVSKSCLTWASC